MSAGVSRCSETDAFEKKKEHRLAQERAIMGKAQGRRLSGPTHNGQPDERLLGMVLASIPAWVTLRLVNGK